MWNFLLDETGRQVQLESGPHLPKDIGKLGSLMPMIPDSDPTCEAIDRNHTIIIEDVQSLVFKPITPVIGRLTIFGPCGFYPFMMQKVKCWGLLPFI